MDGENNGSGGEVMTCVDAAALFSEVLQLEDVEAEDNFFDIGGNSILALILIAEIEQRCGVSLALLDLIRAPTPRGVEGLITLAQAGPPAASHPGPAPAESAL
jgi:acyl carrier protein